MICNISTGGKANPQCSRCGPRTYSKGKYECKAHVLSKFSLGNKMIESHMYSIRGYWMKTKQKSTKRSKRKRTDMYLHLLKMTGKQWHSGRYTLRYSDPWITDFNWLTTSEWCRASLEIASYADVLWARHGRLRNEPKERLRRRLAWKMIQKRNNKICAD